MEEFVLAVHIPNKEAISFYKKHGFIDQPDDYKLMVRKASTQDN